ncbi:MAG: 16S rRNA processing protein RimM [Bacteroidia bacterium]|nr:MAG: 16S rRNA processing protein RimM [Bacteroidia bacterium]
MLVPDGAKAGKISKPYGLRGEVNVLLEPEAGNYMEPDRPLFIDLDGQRVPFFVEEVELVSREQAIVKFEFIDSLDEARAVTGCSFYFDPAHISTPVADADDLNSVVGYLAFDKNMGELGKVSAFIPHSMNPVFIIDYKGKELMVPAVHDFIDQIDSQSQIVHLILPDGLTSL